MAAELAASPQARQEVETVEALAARLKEAARAAPQPEPSPAFRGVVERRLAELNPPRSCRAKEQGPVVVAGPHGGPRPHRRLSGGRGLPIVWSIEGA